MGYAVCVTQLEITVYLPWTPLETFTIKVGVKSAIIGRPTSLMTKFCAIIAPKKSTKLSSSEKKKFIKRRTHSAIR